jgi:hypothetical protein
MNRKKVSEPAQAQTANLQEQASVPSEAKPIKKHIRRVEEFDEYVSPETGKPQAAISIPAREVPEEEEDYIDPIEELLNQIDEEQQFLLRVDRLPEYARTGRSLGRGVATEYCDEFPFDPDYMKLVQRFGGGTYRLTLKNSSHKFVKQWKVHVANPVVIQPATPHASVSASHSPAYSQPVQQQQADSLAPLSQLAEVAKQLKAIKRDMGWEPEPQTVKEIVRQAEVVEKPLEEKILEKLLGLAEKNEPLADRLLGKYLGEEKHELGWKEIIAEIAKPIVPLIGHLMIAQLRAQQVAAGQPVTPAPQLPMPELPQMPMSTPPGVTDQAFQPSADSQPIQQFEDEPQMELIDSLVNMLDVCVRQAAADPAVIEAGRREVESFRHRNPLLAGMVTSLIADTPEGVLDKLAWVYPDYAQMKSNPIAIHTIAALQAKLRGE